MMSLYNISSGNPAERKISDFLVGDLLNKEPEEDGIDDEELFDEETNGFVSFLSHVKADEYSGTTEENVIIKEEISFTKDESEREESTQAEYENAFSFEKLPQFALDLQEEGLSDEELLDIDLSDMEGLTEEEKSRIEQASQIAGIRKILDEMLETKRVEAKELLDTAVSEATLIRQTAEYAADKIKKDAYVEAKAQGHMEGYEEGMKEAQKTIAAAIEKEIFGLKSEVSGIISSVSETKVAIVNNFIDDLRDLAISTAEKVVKVSLESSGEVIKGMILSAVEELQKTKWLKIYISRYDFELLKETDYDLLDALASVSEDVKIVVMEEEPVGTAIVETPQEVIDLSVGSQLNNIKEIVNNAL